MKKWLFVMNLCKIKKKTQLWEELASFLFLNNSKNMT